MSVAAGLDLTTFSTSYQHERRLNWNVQFGAGLEGSRFARLADPADLRRTWLRFEPELAFGDRIRSDNLDWNATVYGLPSIKYQSDNNNGATVNYSLRADPTLERSAYFARSDFFIRTDLIARGGGEERAEDDSTGLRRLASTKLDGEVKLTLGVGYGRVRDAWPLLKAARIAELLRSEGVLHHEPDSAELAELASFLSRSWRFAYDHDRPDKFYYDSLTARLQERGIIAGALPARSLFRLDDQLFVGSYERPFGWKASVFVRPDAFGSLEWGTYSMHVPFTNRVGFTGMELGAEGEYDRPLGLEWLVTTRISYGIRPSLGTGPAVRQDIHRASADIGATWQVFDRAALVGQMKVNVEQRRYHEVQLGPVTDLSGSCLLGAQYFLTRLLSLQVELRSDVGRAWSPEAGPWTRSTDVTAGFGLGHTACGRF